MNKKNKGMILPIALFVLVGIILSAAILTKSTGLVNETAGNIGLKNKATNNNDLVTARAIDWLTENKNSLNYDEERNGYFSSAPATYPDYTKEEVWINAKKFDEDEDGNKASYIIYRMCSQGNRPYNAIENGIVNQCAVKSYSESEDNNSSVGFDSGNFKGNPQVFFKIVTKTEGVKSSKSISETIISMSQ